MLDSVKISENDMEILWLSPAYGLELLGPHGHGQLLLLLSGCRPYLQHTHKHSVLTILKMSSQRYLQKYIRQGSRGVGLRQRV
jgi:hypothetical protein